MKQMTYDEMLDQYEAAMAHLVALNQRLIYTSNQLAAENAYLHQKVAEEASMEFTTKVVQ